MGHGGSPGYESALKIEPAAFLQEEHPQRWAADLCTAEICSICLTSLTESSLADLSCERISRSQSLSDRCHLGVSRLAL